MRWDCKLRDARSSTASLYTAPTNKSAVLNLNVAAPVGLSTSTVTAPINQSQPSVAPLAKKARIEALKAQLDADVVQLFCVGGLPPSKADLPEWKTMWLHAVPSYSPVSSSTPVRTGCARIRQDLSRCAHEKRNTNWHISPNIRTHSTFSIRRGSAPYAPLCVFHGKHI